MFFCMRKAVWLLLLILCVSLVQAQYYNKDSMDLNLRLDSEINIVPTSSSYSVSRIETKLYFYPFDDFQQEVLEMSTVPETQKTGDYLLYQWEDVEETQLDYSLEAKVRVFDNIQKIKEKIKFPIQNLNPEYLEYTEPGEIIDSDHSSIVQQASMLAEGEDDLYVVVHKLAVWVKENVDYNLNTVTIEASQKASWVLANRQGVCDEMASLFMAMCRSLGIPTKFVSGISYSNDPIFEDPWQAHGWAEVYFPDYGWVPIDVTFDEFGYVDPTHIKLFESIDATGATTKFEWSGRNAELEVAQLDIDVGILKIGEDRGRDVDLKVEMVEEEVGFGSYNLAKVEVENLRNYYVAKTLYLVSTDEVEIEDERKHVLLKPGEKTSFYWIMELTDDLESRYVYEFPVEIRTEKNYVAETMFESKKGAILLSEAAVEQRLSGMVEEEEKILSKGVSIDCEIKEDGLGLGEESEVECEIKNLGNVVLRDLEVCLGGVCSKAEIKINEKKIFNGKVKGEEIGEQQYLVRVENNEVSKEVYLDYAVLDRGGVKVKEINAPQKADYSDEFVISFVLEKVSFATPKNLKIKLLHEGYPNEWELGELVGDKKFEIDFAGSDLGFGENDFEVLVEWEDDFGRSYKTSESFVINLGETSLGQKISVLIKSINRFFGKLVK